MNLFLEGAKAGISEIGKLIGEQPDAPQEIAEVGTEEASEAASPALLQDPPAVETPEEISARLGIRPPRMDLGPAPNTSAGSFDVFGAAFSAQSIESDAFNYFGRVKMDLALEMEALLPLEDRTRLRQQFANSGDGKRYEEAILAAAEIAAKDNPELWGKHPKSIAELDAQAEKIRKEEHEAQKYILDQPGGEVAEFLGRTARSMTDEINLAMMPFGFQGSIARRLLGEAALGAASEAASLPRENRVAKEMGLPTPNALERIGMGAVFGAGFAGAIIGGGRGLGWLRNKYEMRRDGAITAKPQGMADAEAEALVSAAEAKMRGQPTVQQVLKETDPSSPPTTGTLAEIASGGDGRNWAGVAEAGKGYTVLVGPDGKAVRREGTRAWRNNNPGNIEYGPFARSMGAIGTDGRFAVFPSYEMGRKAKAQLLWGSKGYRGKTIGQAIARYAPSFENDTGAYTRSLTKALGVRTDTPMASLTPAQREMMLSVMERVEGFRPGKENGVQVTGPWRNPDDTSQDLPSFSGASSRGYTGEGQVTAGDGFRIEVEYQVVDAASLLRASGDLQPRDRSRMSSDAWIADTAARLDPAQLMPSPTADRGTPIVGSDNVIESGNGRFGAISRVYERHPDRASAYRGAIEAAGFAIPEGVERPVLIARRKTKLSAEDRSRFAIEAQDSGVAVMTPTEIARTQSRAMTSPVLAQLDPSSPLKAEGNAGFVRAAMQALPRSARNAMFDANGMLNNLGERQLREALFARAWPDPDILARFTETDAGELKSLMEALERAAPSWAALKADIEAGLVNPEMDISAFVLDAMRLIGAARDLSKREGLPIAKAVQDLVEDIDLIEGAISPLTAAMVRKFWKNGRAASADEIASFLARYADDARKAGAAGGMFDAPGPRDVLRAIDDQTFGDLPEGLGQARGFARLGDQAAIATPLRDEGFDTGAHSPEAEAVDAEIRDMIEGDRRGSAADAVADEVDRLRTEIGDDLTDFEMEMPDGTKASLSRYLDELDKDAQADAAFQACGIVPAGVTA